MDEKQKLLTQYRALQTAARLGLNRPEVTAAIVALLDEGRDFLSKKCSVAPLKSNVPNKKYHTFTDGKRASRPVNTDLFDASISPAGIAAVLQAPQSLDAATLKRSLYTWAMTFCAANDVLFVSDQKKPGTFFEYFVGHIFARLYNANPQKFTQVTSLGLNTRIPTDYIFDLGASKARIHLPVKTSTRERAIQVWAHQRVLDGLHGQNKFRGVLVCLAETNKQTEQNSVVEVCVPEQWRLYQGYIAQLHRIYYLDPPAPYLALSAGNPPVKVSYFSDFFSESAKIVSLT